MLILVTSGSTITRIDDVRNICNFSSGTFPSQIAEESLCAGHKVLYLHAKRAVKPFQNKFIVDPHKLFQNQVAKIKRFKAIFLKLEMNLELFEYQTFEEYESLLKHILKTRQVDVVFLGAAVSDYGLKAQTGKIDSNKNELLLHLTRNKKLIKEVKKWSKKHPFQVGFKLLSGANKEALIETAYKAGLSSHSDLTVANDLQTIKSGEREIFVVTPERGVIRMEGDTTAKNLVKFVVKRAATKHFKTLIQIDKNLPRRFENEFEIFRTVCKFLHHQNFMPAFFCGSKSSHGSMALRVPDGFLITARGSDKGDLSDSDIVLVSKVDWEKREILLTSSANTKASLNAPLMQSVFESLPKVGAIVHTHSFLPEAASTNFPETPGTQEYVSTATVLLRKKPIINLRNHGVVSIASNIIQALSPILKPSTLEGECYEDFPEHYDLLYHRYLKTVPAFISLVVKNTPTNGHVLDLAAGTGEVSIPLLEEGFYVTSIDASRGMLKQLKKKAGTRHSVRLDAHVQSIEHLTLKTTYDTICIRQAINYYPTLSALENGLKSIYSSLNRSGSFVFNAPNFDSERSSFKAVHSTLKQKGHSGVVVEYNEQKGRKLMHTQKVMFLDGKHTKVISDHNTFTLFTKDEFKNALIAAGFSRIRFFSSKLKPYTKNDKTLYCVAKK